MRVACLLDNGFEDSEFRRPYDALRQAGHEVTVIGLRRGDELSGYKGDQVIRADSGLEEVSPDAFDALLIPGGYSPDHLRADERAVEFTRAFFVKERPVFAVCHGPQLLLSADVVKGRRMTAWPTVQGDLRKAGSNVVDEETVIDRRLLTSRKPDDLDAFCREAVGMLQGASVGSG
ncbi:MAG: type 1 glutamine amidotransferase domain-containing protein [Candidatus Dormibacteria bacterium]